MTEDQFVKISFREAFAFLLRGVVPALALASVVAVAAYYISLNPVPIYRSTAILLVTRTGSANATTTNVIEPSQVDPDIYRSAVLQAGLLGKALNVVQGAEPSASELATWRRNVRVRVDEGLISGLVRIEVDHQDSQLAAAVANAVADELMSWDRGRVGQNVQATISSLDRSLVILSAQAAVAEQSGDSQTAQILRATREQRLAQLRSAEALNLSAVVIGLLEPFKSAVAEMEPVNDKRLFTTAVAFILTVLLVYVALFFARVTDPRVRDSKDVERLVGTEFLAFIPVQGRRPAFSDGIGRLSTLLPLPRLDTSVDPVAGSAGRVFLITSPSVPAERALLAPHLANAYRRAGWRVLLVDGDLVSGTLSASLPPSHRGATLVGLLHGGDSQGVGPSSSAGGLEPDFIAAGDVPVEGAALLLGRRIKRLMGAWRSHYDIVVIDASSISMSAGALTMAAEADAVILAILRSRTRIAAAQTAAKELYWAGAKFIGAVLIAETSRPRSSAMDDRQRPTARTVRSRAIKSARER